MYSWIEKAKTIFDKRPSFDTQEEEVAPNDPPQIVENPSFEKVQYLSKSSLQEAQIQSLLIVLSKPRIEFEILQQLCFDGIPEKPTNLKATCWKILLGYLPLETGTWEDSLREKRKLYGEYLADLFENPVHATQKQKASATNVPSNSAGSTSGSAVFEAVDPEFDPLSASSDMWQSVYEDMDMKREIEKDIRRTHQTLTFFHEELPEDSMSRNFECNFGMDEPTHAAVMTRILLLYAKLNPGVKYVQGMNELLSPLYYVFSKDDSDASIHAEADSFYCFTCLMSFLQDRFIKACDDSQIGLNACLQEYDDLLRRIDEPISDLFNEQGMDSRYYALRWLSVLLAMEFEFPDVLRLWDSFLSDPNKFSFVTFFAIAMIILVRDQILNNDFAHNMQLLQHYSEKNEFLDINTIFKKAMELQRLLDPTIFQGVSYQ